MKKITAEGIASALVKLLKVSPEQVSVQKLAVCDGYRIRVLSPKDAKRAYGITTTWNALDLMRSEDASRDRLNKIRKQWELAQETA